MGINGLLPFVKNACRKGSIVELKGCSVAIDVSCLLHRALCGCMDQIHMGEETDFYIHYVKKYIDALLAMGCHVMMVFDGRPLPAKKDVNDDRRTKRDNNVRAAELLLARGQVKEAREKFRLATKISRDIVEKTIAYFRQNERVDVIVAPYEADAQLAYLMTSQLADAVVTEDSDLIVFGCEQIFFKWDHRSGECTVYERRNLASCFTGEMGGAKFDFAKFRRVCILAGCDYLQSGLQGVGLATALKFFSKTSDVDLRSVLPKIPMYLNNVKLRGKITSQFIDDFIRAENTFMHQIVFDPRERCQKPLTPYPTSRSDLGKTLLNLENLETSSSAFATPNSSQETQVSEFEYAGEIVAQRTAVRLALGNEADEASLDDKFLLPKKEREWSVWSAKFQTSGTIRRRQEKANLEKATRCGAFVLDASNAKKARSSGVGGADGPKKRQRDFLIDEVDNDDIIAQFMADVDDAQRDDSAPKSSAKPKEPPKKQLRNGAADDWSAESMMALYGNKSKSSPQTTETSKREKNSCKPLRSALKLATKPNAVGVARPVELDDDDDLLAFEDSPPTTPLGSWEPKENSSDANGRIDPDCELLVVRPKQLSIGAEHDDEKDEKENEADAATPKDSHKSLLGHLDDVADVGNASTRPSMTRTTSTRTMTFASPLLGRNAVSLEVVTSSTLLEHATTPKTLLASTSMLLERTTTPTTVLASTSTLLERTATRPATRQSSYFANRSNNCSNPFRVPIFVKTPSGSSSDAPDAEKKPSLAEGGDEESDPAKKTSTISAWCGFKGAGLRRKSSNK